MPSQDEPYMLSQASREDIRLDKQHFIVTRTVQNGHLLHPVITANTNVEAVADIGCGTGVWLNEVARQRFPRRAEKAPLLVGWDYNAKNFSSCVESGVQLHQHDAIQPFPEVFHGKFDVVNLRVLAYAIPETDWPRVLENIVQILKPGGYFQWTEGEMWNCCSLVEPAKFKRVNQLVGEERRARKLVNYMPPFMIHAIGSLGEDRELNDLSTDPTPATGLELVHFRLCPVNTAETVAAHGQTAEDEMGDIVTDAIKLLLTAKMSRLSQESSEDSPDHHKRRKEVEELLSFLEESLKTPGMLKIRCEFPQLIARKPSASVASI